MTVDPAAFAGRRWGKATAICRSAVTRTTVYFDGACPLCAREIAFYRRRRGAGAIDWIDVSVLPDGPVTDGLSRRAALARFHLRTGDGRIVSGGAAFAHLWSGLPAFRPLGALTRCWPLSWLADRGYEFFLIVRPWLMRRIASSRQNAGSNRWVPCAQPRSRSHPAWKR